MFKGYEAFLYAWQTEGGSNGSHTLSLNDSPGGGFPLIASYLVHRTWCIVPGASYQRHTTISAVL
jgi:hypothetical protein